MISLSINGQPINVPEGTTLLQAARSAGIDIPTLCDHPELTPYGGCRLCNVEIDGWRTPVASCTMPAAQGMSVKTDTPALRESRKFILDMLFSERNHFCPFCQVSGGDCELQNAAYSEGMTSWDFPPAWKRFEVDASHPEYVLDHNRCILCRRCVRACGELVGNFTLTTSERGSATLITADYGIPLGDSSCVSCGMCVQVCPTGALIDRDRAYLGLEKDLKSTRSTCAGCSVGCGVILWTRDNQLVGIDGDWNALINHGVICHLGRHASVIDQRPRLIQPLVRKNGALIPVSWDEALMVVVERLQPFVGVNNNTIAALISTRLPIEDLAIFHRLFAQGLGSNLVTSIEEGMPTAVTSNLAKTLGRPFEGKLNALDSSDLIITIGVDLAQSHQVAGFMVKRRISEQTPLVVIDPGENGLKARAHLVIEPGPDGDAALIADTLSVLQNPSNVTPLTNTQRLAMSLIRAERPVIMFGKGVTHQSDGTALRLLVDLCQHLERLGKICNLISLKGEANSLAAAQYGLDSPFHLDGHEIGYLMVGDDFPTQRLINRVATLPYKIVQASSQSKLTEIADVVLPVTTWSEQNGHYLNLDGHLQVINTVIEAPPGVRSNRDVLTEIASSLNIDPSINWKEELVIRIPPVELDLY